MEVLKGEVHKRTLFMGNISPKIFANNNVPSFIKFLVELSFDVTCNFAEFLSLEKVREISDLLNGCVGDTDDRALVFGLKIGDFNKHFLVVFAGAVIIIILEIILDLLVLVVARI